MAIIALPGTARRIVARCPRCSGRLALERDRHGAYLSCIACGCVLEERAGREIGQPDEDAATWWRSQAS
jgi:hypothetical protein